MRNLCLVHVWLNDVSVPCNLRLLTLLVVLHMWLDIVNSHKVYLLLFPLSSFSTFFFIFYNKILMVTHARIWLPTWYLLYVLVCNDFILLMFILQVVVFLSTCDSVDFHYALLNDFLWSFSPRELQNYARGFINCKSFRLHGNMSQQERTDTFIKFNKEESALLLCTDVAARGLDIPRVTHILQYDLPGDACAYVHRCSLDFGVCVPFWGIRFHAACDKNIFVFIEWLFGLPVYFYFLHQNINYAACVYIVSNACLGWDAFLPYTRLCIRGVWNSSDVPSLSAFRRVYIFLGVNVISL